MPPLSAEEHARLLAAYEQRVVSMVGVPEDYPQRWRAWCRAVLWHGGELVVPPRIPEVHLDQLLQSAELATEPVRSAVGEHRACHANVARLWIDGDVESIGTGYALSDDGLWRQHSWGLDPDATIVETTDGRVAYIGVRLDDLRSLEFAMGNDEEHMKSALRSGSDRGRQLRAMVRDAVTQLRDDRP